MGFRAWVRVAGIALLAGPGCVSTAPATDGAGTVLWISDIHFDPFYTVRTADETEAERLIEALVDRGGSTPRWRDVDQWAAILAGSPLQGGAFSRQYKDSNFKLLAEVLDRAAMISPDPDFILITGDFLGHGFGIDYSSLAPDDLKDEPDAYRGFVKQTLAFIAHSVRSRYPADPSGDAPPVYATLGNNDANCGDYDIHLDTMSSTFLADAADTFQRYFLIGLSAADKKDFADTFAGGGYYAVTPRRSPGNRLILLNSIPFLPSYPDNNRGDSFPETQATCAAQTPIDVAQQFGWLGDALPTAPGKRAWIAAHVPPGENCYSSKSGTDVQYWSAGDTASLESLLLAPAHRAGVAGFLAAHSHSAEFKVIRDGASPFSFVLMAPSVSPNHGNNPSFRVMEYDRATLGVTDYHTHYKDLYSHPDPGCETAGTCWKHFSFSTGFQQASVDAASLDAVFRQFEANDATALHEYARDFDTRAGGSSIGPSWQSFPGCVGSLSGD